MRKNKFLRFFLWALVAGLVFVSFSCSLKKEKKLLEVHFINVGYGDSILIKFPDHTNLLIDAGRKDNAAQILGYLKSHDIKSIDRALLTHPHANQFGSFPEILKAFPTGRFYINGDEKNAEKGYAELMQQVNQFRIPVEIVSRGEIIPSKNKNISMKVLHPADLSGSANANSTVLWLTYGQTGFLFTADIGEAQQDEIMRLYPQLESVSCIKVPHKGKDVSDLFAAFFAGKTFIVSTGADRGRVLNLKPLQKLYGKIFRTDWMGNIVVESDGSRIQVRN